MPQFNQYNFEIIKMNSGLYLIWLKLKDIYNLSKNIKNKWSEMGIYSKLLCKSAKYIEPILY